MRAQLITNGIIEEIYELAERLRQLKVREPSPARVSEQERLVSRLAELGEMLEVAEKQV